MTKPTANTKPTPPPIRGYTQEEIDSLPAVIGKSEVSHIARVSERTVTREASKGNLNGSFRVGNQWRFNTNAICEQFGQVR